MAQQLKDTLNLPKTEFPMRANLVSREPARQRHWESRKLYASIQERNASGPRFVLHDGPPFTNGDLHLGHALNKTLKEIVLRYKSMRGFRTPYVPGWDCHGLPIEHKVTRDLQAENKVLPPAELRDACDRFAEFWIGRQRSQFQRLGVLADWDREYKTKDPAYEAEILRTFAAFVEQGLVYRSKKPVYWSIPCETALAEAEIEYKEHTSPSIWVKFPIPADQTAAFGLPPGKSVSAVIWTTTPWTLPANLALAVHPRVEYAFVDAGAEILLIAAPLASRFASDVGLDSLVPITTVPGARLEHLSTRHPFLDRASPVLLADYVTTESGTGVVHTAPGHGLDDYVTATRYGLEIYCPVDDRGVYLDDGRIPADLVGISVLETEGRCPANDAVLKKLKQAGALLRIRKLIHSYPFCWRSKTPVIYRALDQWFVALDKHGGRERALRGIAEVNWIPKWGENRIRGAVESRPDWVISRQRVWGVPIPAFYDADGQAYLDAGVSRAIADKVGREGTNLWFRGDAGEILAGIDLPESWRGRELTPGRDTLDVWIDSGTSHLAVLRTDPQLAWPADLYLEGSDQHRGWFQSSLWTGIIVAGHPPYRSILTHGFVVDQDGRKLSKSEGKPLNLEFYINKYGADIVRLWIASQDFRSDIPISEEILSHVGETYRLFRNTLRFQISNLHDFNAGFHAVPIEQLDRIDRWAIDKTAELLSEVTAAYEASEFHRVYQLCNQFCSVTLSAIYHDILKDRLYTYASASPLRRSSQTAIATIFSALVRVLAPIIPFTADEAWSYAATGAEYVEDSVHLQAWPQAAASWREPETRAEIDGLLRMRGRLNEFLEASRQRGEIGKSLDAQVSASAPADSSDLRLLEKYRDQLAEIFIVSQVSLSVSEAESVDFSVKHADGLRCPRCWRWVPALENAVDHGEVCPRCAAALQS